jgi:hypothetical protein
MNGGKGGFKTDRFQARVNHSIQIRQRRRFKAGNNISTAKARAQLHL